MSKIETTKIGAALTCAVCGTPGVSMCSNCSKKPGWKTALARATPLRDRDPELYKRLDELSNLPLAGNENKWGEFLVEIKAGDYYEHAEILVEIVKERGWETDVLNVKPWLRKSFVQRVKRLRGRQPENDYGHNGKRLRPGPEGWNFDRRNGALIEFEVRPFCEFEVVNQDGDTCSPEEVIDGSIARKEMQTRGDGVVVPADRESLRFLGRMTRAERLAAIHCEEVLEVLRHDKHTFDTQLARTITNLRKMAERLALDQDEAEAVAVKTLLWTVGPRTYLNFLDATNRRRIRNAWDRLDRKIRNPEWAALFRQTLRKCAQETRKKRSEKYWADYDRRIEQAGWRHLVSPSEGRHRKIPQEDYGHCPRCGEDRLQCECLCGGWLDLSSIKPPRAAPNTLEGIVGLACDLLPGEKHVRTA